ncbi:sulfatase-like hydrolase/transferase [Bythopirellula polymerisocia]|uniref:Arylsulfatase n=1 Tax=Bythopirellula polymerisocia TaxID=2528003 RepID=A0A5C6CK34_9BACT|nr:sulfatase-like hydrolase/transferase [Bythopirellula polymerisocia]TWU24752.1 Arylsulfatase [Bythopirellula polymerisocia]
MSYFTKILIALLFSNLVVCTTFAVEHDRPNVVLILSDDQGWQDYGFMGSNVVQTPHLDRLARNSLLFERGYVVSPLCRPSLASIVTGLFPHQHGVCANDVSPASGLERQKANQPVYESFHRHPSWIRTLVENGYLAFQSGKWWEGSWHDGGFTHGMTHGDSTRGGRHGDEGLKIGRQGLAPITQFIDQAVAAEKPFVVWYAPFIPHTPHNPPPEILKKYQIAGRPVNLARYYAMCEWFDSTCGELLGHLEKHQITDNTLVVFLADNGWAARDDTSKLPEGWWNDYAPRSKGSPFEEGIRTPIMISWPEAIPPGRSTDLASSVDVMPTVLNACGLNTPADLPGIDLRDETARRNRDTVFGAAYSIHNMNPGDPESTLQYRWCIQDTWKLILRSHGSDITRYKTVHEWDDVPARLYNLKLDPGENKNLSSEEQETVRELSKRIAEVIPATFEDRSTPTN